MNKMDRDDDRRRFRRIDSAMKDIVNPLLSNFLEENYKSGGFDSFQAFLNSQRTLHTLFHLKNKLISCCRDDSKCKKYSNQQKPLNGRQWNMLYSKIPGQCNKCHCQFGATQVRPEDLDISLTTLILLNCCILQPGDYPMILNLREYRNNIQHKAQSVLKETDFNAYKAGIQRSVMQIDASKYADLVRLLNKPLKENDEEISEPYRFEDFSLKSNQMVNPPALLGELSFNKTLDGVMMEDGRLALCCSYVKNGYCYGYLLIYDGKTQKWDSMQTGSLSTNLISVDDSTVAVLLLETPSVASLVLYDIKSTPKWIQTIELVHITDFSNKIIALFHNKILVGVGKGFLCNVDPKTRDVEIIRIKNGMVSHLYVCGDKIIYVLENRELNCVQESGKEVFSIMLQSPLVALTFLEDDGIIVLYRNGSMQRISPDGKSCVTVKIDGLAKESVQDCVQMSYNKFVKKMSLFYISGKIQIFDRTS